MLKTGDFIPIFSSIIFTSMYTSKNIARDVYKSIPDFKFIYGGLSPKENSEDIYGVFSKLCSSNVTNSDTATYDKIIGLYFPYKRNKNGNVYNEIKGVGEWIL